MPDNFAGFAPSILHPVVRPHSIPAGAPSADIELPFTTRAIQVDGAGVLSIRAASGDSVTITNPDRGSLLAIRATHVLTTNTAALVCWE